MPVSRFNSIYSRMTSMLGVRREDSSSRHTNQTKSRFSPSQNFQTFRNRFKRHIELVDIPRTGPVAQLPVELQLEIFFHLDHAELKNVRSTCRYYRHFISKTMLDDARERTISRFKEIERQGRLKNNEKPCYTCLRMMRYTEFHDPNASRSSASGTTGNQASTMPVGTRYCIDCGLKSNKFQPGQGIIRAGRATSQSTNQAMAICKHCKRLQRQARQSSLVRPGYACRSCDTEVTYLQEHGPKLRATQAVLATVIFALSFSGRAVPRSSHVSYGTWRWIYTISLVCFHAFYSRNRAMHANEYAGSLYHWRLRHLLLFPKSAPYRWPKLQR